METTQMIDSREMFESSEFVRTIIHNYEWSDEFNNYQIKDCVINGNVFDFIEAEKDQPILNGAWFGWKASAQREGYKLVPVEPTKAMMQAVVDEVKKSGHLADFYKAMIGAAP